MASKGGIEAGRGFVTLGVDDGPLLNGLRAARNKVQSWSAQVQSIATGVMRAGAVVGGLGATLAAPFIMSISAASDAAEAVSKFQQVFGTQADAAGTFVETLANSIGRGRTEIMDAMSAFQSQFVGLGFGAENARAMSEEMTKLAYDFASFHNLADQESFGRFISAMSGSSEVLDQFGVNIKAAALDEEFLRMGLRKTTANATEQEKTIARLNIIRASMGRQGAMGDALRTSDGFANTLKRVKAQIADLSIAVGTHLLPPLALFLSVAAKAIMVTAAWARGNATTILSIAGTAAALIAAGVLITGFGGALFVLATLIKAAGIALGFASTVVGVIWSGALLVAKVATIAYSAVMSACSFVVGLFTGATWLSVAAIAAFVLGGAVLIALGAALVFKFGEVREAFSSLGPMFERLGGSIKQAWGGIADALSAGNFAQAGEIALAALNVIWIRSINSLSEGWHGFVYLLQNSWQGIIARSRHALIDLGSIIIETYHSIAGTIENIFTRIVGRIAREIDRMVSLVPEFIRSELNISSTGFDADAEIARNDAQRERDRAARQASNRGEHMQVERDALAAMRPASDALSDRQRANARAEADAQASLSSLEMQAWFDAQVAAVNRQMTFEPGDGSDMGRAMGGGTSSVGAFGASAAAILFGGARVDHQAQMAGDIREQNDILADVRDRLNNMEGLAVV